MENNIISIDNAEETNLCKYCGKLFQTKRGINIHISRAHPSQYRDKIVNHHTVSKRKDSNFTLISNDNTQDDNRSAESTHDDTNKKSNSSTTKFNKKLSSWKNIFSSDLDDTTFDIKVDEFISFLASAVKLLPGPKHPAQKYYELRKTKNKADGQHSYKQSSNPQRATKRDRAKRKNKFQYDLAQYYYYNQRRKAIRMIFNDDNTASPSDTKLLHEYFSGIFSKPNNLVRDEYVSTITEPQSIEINDTFNPIITKEEIMIAMKKIAIDTSSGPDHVIMRTIKNGTASEIIAIIASRMLSFGIVPSCLKQARTILIHKGGDVNSPSNYRPITICSVIRRVIERVLDKRIRAYVSLNPNQ